MKANNRLVLRSLDQIRPEANVILEDREDPSFQNNDPSEDMGEESVRVRMAQRVLRDLAVRRDVDITRNTGLPPRYKRADYVRALANEITTFEELHAALLAAYSELDPTRNYRNYYRPLLEISKSGCVSVAERQSDTENNSVIRGLPRRLVNLDGPYCVRPISNSERGTEWKLEAAQAAVAVQAAVNQVYGLERGSPFVHVCHLPWTSTYIPWGREALSPGADDAVVCTMSKGIAESRVINLGWLLEHYRLSEEIVSSIKDQVKALLAHAAERRRVLKNKLAGKGLFIGTYHQVYVMLVTEPEKPSKSGLQVVLAPLCLRSFSHEEAKRRNKEFYARLAFEAGLETENPKREFRHRWAAFPHV